MVFGLTFKKEKMKYLKILLLLFISQLVYSQVPTGFNYQGLLLDDSRNGIANKEVTFQVSISADEAASIIYLVEAHDIKTDNQGVFNLVIGAGTELAGSIDAIDWLASVPYIDVTYNLNDGKGDVALGQTRFNTVPFCFQSKYIVCQEGRQGPLGPQGAQGPQGPASSNGAQGSIGPSGAAGTNGADGIANMPISINPPAQPVDGTFYLDSGNNRSDGAPGFRYFDGSNWIDL